MDRLGRLWIHGFDPDPATVTPWFVTNPAGRLIARISLPHELDPLDIGRDYVLGRARDELEVETIVLFEIDA